VAQLAAPFAITARAADEVKFGGLNDPLTGTYAELGRTSRSAANWRSSRSMPKAGSSAMIRPSIIWFWSLRRGGRHYGGAAALALWPHLLAIRENERRARFRGSRLRTGGRQR
jgi:hypothetical protein